MVMRMKNGNDFEIENWPIRNKEAEQNEFENIISTEENRTKEALNEIINSVKHGDEEEKDQLLEQKIEELSAKIDKLMAKMDG